VTQAALLYLRAQRSGHIIQVSSIGGITAFPLVGIYHALEVGAGGVVAIAGPGGRRVRHPRDADRAGRLRHRLVRPSSTISQALLDYAELHQQVAEVRKQRWAKPGDPKASAAALLKVVDAEQPPLRVFFGETPLQTARADYESRLANWEQWQPVAVEAQDSYIACAST
jgi:NAD(P)-dependent dehydrogenase (short-subunit alcohol dehydrogenase family)